MRNFDAVATSSRGKREAEASPAAGDAGIGRVLKAARAERGASLADLQARTKIRIKYLAALEEERLEELPPYPFTRGFLQAYARELGVEPEPLLSRLALVMRGSAESMPGDWRRLESAVKPAVPASRARRLAVSVGITAIIIAAGLAVFFAKQFSEFSQPVPAAVPEVTTQPTASPSPGSVETPGAAPSQAVAVPPAAPVTAPGSLPQVEAGVTIELRASGRSWVRTVADGQTLFEGFVTAGETTRWQSRGPMTIRLGNAGVVGVTVNGKAMGTLGGSGEVVERTFSGGDAH